jgi:HK97 family phage major capsid protein
MPNPSLSLTEVTEALAEKRQELHKIFEEAGPNLDLSKVTIIHGDTEAKAVEIRRRNDELTDLGQQYDRLSLLQQIGKLNAQENKRLNDPVGGIQFTGANGSSNGSNGTRRFEPHHLKQLLLENKNYRAFRDGLVATASVEIPVPDYKTLVTLTTINRLQQRQAEVIPLALETRTVGDLMLQGNTDANLIEYYEETTFTNNAATVAEGGTKVESALGYTLRQETVRKIAHFVPATKEALDDVSFLESTIRGRLAFGVERAEETQLLSGTGVAPQLLGILNRSGIQTQAKGADPTPDAIYKAMQLIRGAGGAGFAEPTGVVLHPNDWTDIKLLRTADGLYIWGNPSDEGPDRIWGLPIRQTTAMTQNTGLVGAFRPWSEVIRREGITITLSTEHSTFFIENKVAILAEERLALAIYRPSAFATVTGI